VTMIAGSAPAWIKEFAEKIKCGFKSGERKQNKWKDEDSHPDFQFTKKWLEELDIEEKKRNMLIKRALARMNRYRLREKAETFNLKKRNLADEAASTEVLKTEKHFPIKEVGFSLALLALVIIFWFLSGWIYHL
jgi:hypothetical protein